MTDIIPDTFRLLVPVSRNSILNRVLKLKSFFQKDVEDLKTISSLHMQGMIRNCFIMFMTRVSFTLVYQMNVIIPL